ncbi:tripartite tricarboxylate transporter substrate binding protein [Bradyrhizobium sp. LHD-71]|uniref:Bug family tripartite tricarboxylate transporter substrate binding protein n=1 Tax=Bradyrhizobium sp. LHD-71 TaxID=3072141 RepID=UPI00280EF59A|nr:tripartite tricarboxylate transporter substrate binding protein [Bradyrhizobium sp. LHD-71]MDQ8731966.1 tripartite tricarboxylate transporter substrate binding protein [Bradyrhizobium sp. LHD-71]
MTSLVIVTVCLGFGLTATAQPYPSRQVTLVVPFPAGSATDGVARRLADSLKDATGATVIVENKPGADGNLAALSVLRAEPDGYTVFVTTNSTHAANVNLFNSMPYDPRSDFAPVAGIMTIPMMLTVKPDFPAKSVSEFIAVAKSREKPLAFASGNTSSRGAAELFKSRAAIPMQHVPYRGMPQAITDVVGGQVELVFADTSTGMGLVRDRALRAIAVTASKRLASLPDVPTIAESGLPGYEFAAWVGVFVHARTPKDIVAKLNQLVTTFVDNPATISYLGTIGAAPFPSTPEQLAAFAEADTKRWAEIVDVAKMEKK